MLTLYQNALNPPPSPSVGMTDNMDDNFAGAAESPADPGNGGSDVDDADYGPGSDASGTGSDGSGGGGEDVGSGDGGAGSGGDSDYDELDDDDRRAMEELRKKLLQKKKGKASTKPKRVRS